MVSIATTFISASTMLIHLVVGEGVRKNRFYCCSSGSNRRLREKIEQQDKSGDFVKFVQDCFAKAERSYCEEFGGEPPDT